MKRSALSLLLTIAVVLTALAPATASAEPSEADRATARQLVVAGYEALDRKDYAAAADCFERANSLFPAPTIGLGLGRARLGLGKLIGAQDAFSRAANTHVSADMSDAFKKAIDDARHELEAMTPRVPSVVIEVRGTTAPTVTLDDAEVPAAALGIPRPADPGRHVIRARAAGFANGEATVTLVEGRTEKVVLELKPGESTVPATPPPAAAAPGALAPAGTTTEPQPTPPPTHSKGSGLRMVSYGAIGLGAAGLVVGGITGGLAIGAHNTFINDCGGTSHCAPSLQPKYQGDLDSYHTMAGISTVAFIAGGAVAATGVVLLLTGPSPSPSTATVTPAIGLGYLGINGRF